MSQPADTEGPPTGAVPRCALGIDIGTTTVKLVIVEQTGNSHRQVWAASAPHVAYLPRPAGCAEQSVARILRTLDTLARRAPRECLSQVSSVGVTCQMHGVVRWQGIDDSDEDRSLAAVWRRACSATGAGEEASEDWSTLVTWEDQRCDEAFLKELNSHQAASSAASTSLQAGAAVAAAAPSSCISEAGHHLSTGFGIASLAWLARHSPQPSPPVYSHVGTIGDLVVYLLSAAHRHCMDATNAAGFGAFDAARGEWDVDRIRSYGLAPSLLPALVPSALSVGSVHAQFAREWGLPPHATVHAAVGDHPASVFATGAREEEIVVSMGTSAQIARITTRDMVGDYAAAQGAATSAAASPLELRPYVSIASSASAAGPHVLLLGASLSGGNVLSAFVDGVCKLSESICGQPVDPKPVWSRLIERGMELTRSPESLAALPDIDVRFFGERHSPGARGAVTGLSFPLLTGSGETEMGGAVELFVALCRGVVRNLHGMMIGEAREDAQSQSATASPSLAPPATLHLVGSLFARNPLLRFFLRDAFGVADERVRQVGEEVDAAYGVARMAMETR